MRRLLLEEIEADPIGAVHLAATEGAFEVVRDGRPVCRFERAADSASVESDLEAFRAACATDDR